MSSRRRPLDVFDLLPKHRQLVVDHVPDNRVIHDPLARLGSD
jgi:hypothetical protein